MGGYLEVYDKKKSENHYSYTLNQFQVHLPQDLHSCLLR